MGTEEQMLAESIRTTISKTSDVLWRLLPLQPRSMEEAKEDPSDELIDLDYELSDYLKKLYRDVAILAERMQLPLLCRKISETFNEHRDIPVATSRRLCAFVSDVGGLSSRLQEPLFVWGRRPDRLASA